MVKHFIEYKGKRKEVTFDWPTNPGKLGARSYIEGTRTTDIGRFAKSKNLPLTWKFTDSTNVAHYVTIESESDRYTVAIPVTSEILWFGDEKDRTGLDGMCGIAVCTFSYVGSSWTSSHGIRVEVLGYKYDDMGYFKSDTDSWTSGVELFVKSTEGVKNLAEAYASVNGKPPGM